MGNDISIALRNSLDSRTRSADTESMQLAQIAPVLNRLGIGLGREVDGSSLAVFRMAFGVLIMIECWRYYSKGWIISHFVAPEMNFPFFGLSFLRPLSEDGMMAVFALLAVAGACIAMGLFYRLAAGLFLILFGYIFLLEKSYYLNHFYFTWLLGFLLLLVPADRCWSIASWRRGGDQPIPSWALWAFKAQMEAMLLWAGLVKINTDWLAGKPLGMWLLNAVGRAPAWLGQFLTHPDIGVTAAWGAMLLHLVGAPLLLWRRTRFITFLIYCTFHLMNHFVWSIGIFPWLTIAATTVFFAPDWPRKLMAGVRQPRRPQPLSWGTSPLPPITISVLALFLFLQMVLPLRPYVLFPGPPQWTEEGHRFSWRMMLRSRRANTKIWLVEPTTGDWQRIRLSDHLSRAQRKGVVTRPDMLVQFAHHLRDQWAAAHGGQIPEIRAEMWVSVNERDKALLIGKETDLARVTWSPFSHDDWLRPVPEDWDG